jgi:aldehyde dehydrogenase
MIAFEIVNYLTTGTGKIIATAAAKNLIPTTCELGGKSPMIFFSSVADKDDAFFDKCMEGAVLFCLNQGEICTCPSRILVQEDIYDKFVAKMIKRTQEVKCGDPNDMSTMIGAQTSLEQLNKIEKYIQIGIDEGCSVLTGGKRLTTVQGGFYIQPTILKGTNNMRVFQEEIFGPVVAITTFKTIEEAIAIANDSPFGLGAGVWSRNVHECYQVPRQIQAGRVWINCYHNYPAGAPFGGYKQSGYGRENHKSMLAHYQQKKNLLISYDHHKLGFF